MNDNRNDKTGTEALPRGAKVLNTTDGETGTILRPRMGRNRRIRGYDVQTADGVEAWATGEITRLYEADHAGKKVHVTVPENEDPAEPGKELRDLLQDCMSPHAVAAIVSYLQPCQTKDGAVNKQVAWFSEQLVELLGGYEQQSRLAEELGL
jgi:hypothetical protein